MEAGKCVSLDTDVGSGWKHLTAVRRGGLLRLYVDGRLAAESSPFERETYDISTDMPLRIGFGQTDFFAGRMAEVRLYNLALDETRIRELSAQQPAP
jgi:Concanavalin A-like lectin/glucanases superfamily